MVQFKLPMFGSNYTFNKEEALRQEQERTALENEKKGLQYNPATGTWTKSVVKTVQPRPNSYWNSIASQYGFKDMQAVKDWQTKNGLVADGKFSKNSLAKWNSLQNRESTKKEVLQQQTSPSYWNNYQPYHWRFLTNMWNTRESSAKPLSMGYGRTTAYQQGGTMQQQSTQEQELQKAFLAYLIQDAAQQGIQLQSEQDLQNYAQQLGEEGIRAKYQEFMQKMQGGVMAKLGTKLDYIKKLKGICPEGYELTYFKVGGRICKSCQKKHHTELAQEGKKLNAIEQFKKRKKK